MFFRRDLTLGTRSSWVFRKEVKLGAGKVLLSRVGDDYFATSHLCSGFFV